MAIIERRRILGGVCVETGTIPDSGLVKFLFHLENRPLLGVHATGTGAMKLIHIGQAVLDLGGGLEYFLRTVFNHPTSAECYEVAALDAHHKLTMSA
jgi:NAD(P) transhydrogenase